MELSNEDLRRIIQEELRSVLEAKKYHWNEPDWHYDGGYGDPEGPDYKWYMKMEAFSKEERAKRRKKCDNPKGFTMKQFCKNQKTRSKKGERKNEEIEEVYSDKQRRFMCAVSKQGADRPKGLSKAEAEEMCKGPMKEADPKTGTGKKPKGSGRRLYTDEDPSDTVSVKFSTVQDIKDTLSKASFKSKSHKRQSQIINLIHQRSRAAYKNAKDPKVKARLKKAYEYAEKRKEASKRKTARMNKKKK
tara:strand:+ start:688 stop:1425 length:738 start_codon:yes stop_codon:yes gene_type:complete